MAQQSLYTHGLSADRERRTQPTTSKTRQEIDTNRIKRQADLLRELPYSLRKCAGTGGGEYCGPCPKCGGTDRFHAQPDREGGGLWMCRQCHLNWGDVIELRKWLHGETFMQACAALSPTLNLPPVARPTQSAKPQSEIKKPRPYFSPRAPHSVTARYAYFDSFDPSVLVAIKERIEPGLNGRKKDFRWCRPRPGIDNPQPDNPNHWLMGRENPDAESSDKLLVSLYNIPGLLAALLDTEPKPTVFIFDGEKDVNTALAEGLVATCPPDGWRSWRPEFACFFIGMPVAIVPDQETGGQVGAEKIAQALYPVAHSVKIVAALTLPEGASK